MIEIKNLSHGFMTPEKKITILDNLSFQIQDKEKIAIIGKSGSGKSTLLSILAGIIKPWDGSVIINGKDLTNMDSAQIIEWRKSHVGFIFQQFHLISTLTVLENVMLPLALLKRTNERSLAIKMLERVGLSERLNHFPNQLSGGEAQRVAIARALIHGPDIILADEPSGSLDFETGEDVLKLLFDVINESRSTLILVTHDLDLSKKLDRVVRLDHGKLSI
jgi:putative ABC transport system ATP-binding protein